MTADADFRDAHGPSFGPNDAGAVSVLLGLLALILIGFAGLAVDYGSTMSNKAKLQQILDAAVLAGVSARPGAEQFAGETGGLSDAEKLEVAKQYFASNATALQNVSGESFTFENKNLVGRATVNVEMALLRVLGVKVLRVVKASIATSDVVREPLCFMAMHPSRKHTLELKDSVSVIGPDCNFYGNSSHEDDVVDPHSPENFLVGKSVQAVGFGHHFLANVTPPLEHAPEIIADPLSALVIPTAGTCTFNNTVISGVSRTLSPGTYCGGLSITNGSDVTLRPGTYVISGGGLLIADSTVTGNDITVGLADASAVLFWDQATVRLNAPKTGKYAGIVFAGVRQPTVHSFIGSTVDLHGVVYIPNGDFTWTNRNTPTINAKWTAWIIDGVSWLGDGVITINFDLENSDIPYPQALRVIPRPGSPRLVM